MCLGFVYDPDLIQTVSESVFLVVHTDQDCGICLREMIDLVDRISTEFETPIFAVNRSGENQFTGQKLVRLEYEHLTQKSQILNVHPNLQITSDGCPGGFYGPGKGKRPRSMKCIGCWLLGIMSYIGTSPNFRFNVSIVKRWSVRITLVFGFISTVLLGCSDPVTSVEGEAFPETEMNDELFASLVLH